MDLVERPVCGRVCEMRVIEADHIIGERNHALSSEANTPGWDAAVFVVGQPPICPMTVRIKNRREWALALTRWSIQVSSDIQTRKRLEIDLLDTVAIALDLTENVSIQRRPFWHGPKPAAYQDLFANLAGSVLLLTGGRDHWEITRGVEIFGRADLLINHY